MEPSVDGGIWAIAVLLLAVVIGAAIMLLFPSFVSQVFARMEVLLTAL